MKRSTKTVCPWLLAAILTTSGSYLPEANAIESLSYSVSTAQQAAQIVKKKFGGKVLKVERTKVNGNPGYKVKLLKDNGHVVSVKVNAISGKIES